jgi:hypothetical protein
MIIHSPRGSSHERKPVRRSGGAANRHSGGVANRGVEQGAGPFLSNGPALSGVPAQYAGPAPG